MPLRRFAQGAVTRCGPAFQHGHARDAVCNGAVLLPRACLATCTVWALPRSLATTGGIIVYFLFLEVLRCFSSLRSPPHTKCGWQRFTLPGCPIRKSADQRSFAPTRGLSQLITSFIASVSQGIRHAPFLTFASDCPHGTSKCRGSSYFSFLFEPAPSRQTAVLLVSECQRSVSGTCLTEWRITDSNR